MKKGHGERTAGERVAGRRDAFFPDGWRTRAQRREPREKSAWILATTRRESTRRGEKKCGRHVHPREPTLGEKGWAPRHGETDVLNEGKHEIREHRPGGAATWSEKGSISGRFCATGANMLIKFIATRVW